MARQRRNKRRRRAPLGLTTPEQLCCHRELDFLRVAGQPHPRTALARERHRHHLDRRAHKLAAAQRAIEAATA